MRWQVGALPLVVLLGGAVSLGIGCGGIKTPAARDGGASRDAPGIGGVVDVIGVIGRSKTASKELWSRKQCRVTDWTRRCVWRCSRTGLRGTGPGTRPLFFARRLGRAGIQRSPGDDRSPGHASHHSALGLWVETAGRGGREDHDRQVRARDRRASHQNAPWASRPAASGPITGARLTLAFFADGDHLP